MSAALFNQYFSHISSVAQGILAEWMVGQSIILKKKKIGTGVFSTSLAGLQDKTTTTTTTSELTTYTLTWQVTLTQGCECNTQILTFSILLLLRFSHW